MLFLGHLFPTLLSSSYVWLLLKTVVSKVNLNRFSMQAHKLSEGYKHSKDEHFDQKTINICKKC